MIYAKLHWKPDLTCWHMFSCLVLFVCVVGIHHVGRYVVNANFVLIFYLVIKPFKGGLFQSQHSCRPVVFQVGSSTYLQVTAL
jgi:hypothetical protein